MKKLTLILIALLGIMAIASAQNRALDFNGTDEYVNCGTFNLGDDPTDNSFTYECWFKVDAFGSLTNLMGFEVNGSNTALLRINGTNLEFLWAEAGYSYYVVTGATTLEIDVWYHAAGVFDDNGTGVATAYLFLNGEQDGYATGMGATVSANSTFYIGGSGGRYLNGQMDEVRVWKGVARTQTEVQDNMYTELAGNETGLYAYYKLNETGGSIADNAQGDVARDGTLNNCTFDANSTLGVIIYVDADVSGGDGATWATAYSSLQDALTIAVSGNVIWVAEGTYKPSVDETGSVNANIRLHTFQMKNGVKIYGGFAGGETSVADRHIGSNVTILSGDIGTVGVNTDNCYHVFYHPNGTNLNNTAILDGFTITKGYGDGAIPNNWGSGMYNDGSSQKIVNCTFTDNFSNNSGGAVANYASSSPELYNCVFINNVSTTYGGAFYNKDLSSPTIVNCTFSNNNSNSGGAIANNANSSNDACTPTIINSIFWDNTASSSGNEIYNNNSTPVISYCDIEGSFPSDIWDTSLGNDGGNNIDANPLFAASLNASHPYSLTGLSPCADAGDNSVDAGTYDIRGFDFGRKLDKDDGDPGIIDMGAYEYKYDTDPVGATLFVDELATGLNDGKSWDNAYTSFQSALDIAVDGHEIWVAKGTYYPSYAYELTNTSRYYHFEMINGVKIYGGFAGNETTITARTTYGVGEVNETILSGDIDDSGLNDCYHVFYHITSNTVDNTAFLDGFTITKGYANYDGNMSIGAGMYLYGSSPNINNCSFTSNYANDFGGAMCIKENSNPTITNCLFSSNSTSSISGNYGGAIYIITGSAPTITNCLFTNNSAYNGGAILVDATAPTITNCTFTENTASNAGGGMYNINSGANPIIKNTILWGNTGSSDNNLGNSNGAAPVITSSDIEGGYAGTGNIDANPLFAASLNTSHPYSLTGLSPCADVGDNSAGVNDETYDIRGADFGRKLLKTDANTAGTIDIGAYEYKDGTDPAGAILFVDELATGLNDGNSWDNAYTSFQSALDATATGCEIWVAKGTYKPSYDYGLNIAAPNTERGYHFEMINGVKIYGGFAGTETATTERTTYGVGEVNETKLSGDIDTAPFGSDDCYHVFYHPDGLALDNTAILDGFTITAGYANGTSPHDYGGGMYNMSSSPTINNCTFTSNNASFRGGAMYIQSSNNPTFTNCIFTNNTSTQNGGAAMLDGTFAQSTNPTFVNCTFTNNSVTANTSGGGIYATIYYSNIKGSGGSWPTYLGNDGGNNIDANPLFAGSQNTSHPYSLTGSSPCADVGDNNVGQETYDIRGADFGRNLNKTNGAVSTTDIDMGAYEYKFGTDFTSIIYVNHSPTGTGNDGSSWADAYTSFQSALDAAVGCKIWVAKGTYYPSYDYGLNLPAPNAERGYHFRMKNGVEIYGGFAGTETSTALRTDYGVGGVNETILSGDLEADDDNSNNCYHVFYHPFGTNLDNTAILDGFTITDGNANAAQPYNHGGGMFCYQSSPALNNCNFNSNRADGSSAQTSDGGGAIYLEYSSPSFSNCSFTSNYSGYSGGAIRISRANTSTFTNCIITNNTSVRNGGGVMLKGTSSQHPEPIFVNCTFTNNSVTGNYTGGGIYADAYANFTLKNSIVWGNSTLSGNGEEIQLNSNGAGTIYYSNIKGSYDNGTWNTAVGADGGHNIDSDPFFADVYNDDYILTSLSPCVNKGDNASNSQTYDIRGEARIQQTTIDMGTYEYTSGTDPVYNTPNWTGALGTDFTEAGNWDGGVPTENTNARIPNLATADPVILYNGTADCNNLTVESGATLTIESTVDGTGSLIVAGTATGDVTVERYLTLGSWHYISEPVNDARVFNTFLNLTPETGTDIDQFYWWDEDGEYGGNTGIWFDILNTSSYTNNSFIPSQGYAINYKNTGNTTINFVGEPYTSSQTINITRTDISTGIGSNLVGNPFSSSIAINNNAQTTDNFLSQNSNVLDPSYTAVYFWEETNDWSGGDDYTTKNNAIGEDVVYAAPGQAFMVISKTGGGVLEFNTSIRKHGAAPFYKNSNNGDNPSVTLMVVDAENRKNSTSISFLPNMTLGLDPSYDAGKLKGNPNIALYTRLVEDNGVDFAIQALPDNDIESIIIPVGIDVIEQTVCEFSIKPEVMEGYQVYLHDTQENTVTNLKENSYSTLVSESGTGRFYLHFKENHPNPTNSTLGSKQHH